jgi:diacylglycerol kinase (ATP)
MVPCVLHSARLARPVGVRALFVVNPLARHGRELCGAVRAELLRLGIELIEDRSARGIDAIVVAGGDGTVAREISRAIELGVPIGIVPLGTFNDVARTLSIPADFEVACAIIAAGRTRTIDVARANGFHYLTEASIGVSSRVARRQRPSDKRRFGVLAIAAALFSAVLRARPFHVEIAYDGNRERLRILQLTVANSERFGGFISVADAAIDDGELDLYAIEIRTLREFFSVTSAIVRGQRRSAQGLRVFRSRAFDVWTRRRHHIAADGEAAGRTPARFEVMPGALRVFAPGDGAY